MAERDVELTSATWSSYRLTRRSVMKLSAGLLGAAAVTPLLAACGDDDEPDTPAQPGTTPAPDDDDDDEETPEPDDDAETPEPDDDDDEPDAPGEGQYGGELIYALSSDPPNLDPHVHTGTAARAVKLQVYNSLLIYDRDGSPLPALAFDWEVTDDGMEYTFHLRDDVTFHSGEAFTSADVRATYERIQDDAVGAFRNPQFLQIEEIDDSDDYTVILRMEIPNAAMIEYMCQPETSIMSQAFLDAGEDPDLDMVGTGPFRFVEREPGVRVIVERYDDYFMEGLPYLDRIVFVPYADENTRIAAVQGGEVHIGDYVPWRDMQAVEDDPNLYLAPGDQSAFMCVIYNCRDEPLDDPAVRHALGFAYDRDAIAEAAFFGRAEEMTGGVIPPGHWAFNDQLQGTYDYDPDRAQQLLEEAGWGDGFALTLMSTSQYGMHQNTAEIVQSNLNAIGIDCTLELFDWATVVQRHTDSDYEFRIQGTAGDSNDPDFLTIFFHSVSANARSMGFSDSQIDEWLEEGRATVDQDGRREIYAQIEERILELAPWTFLVYRQDGEAVRQGVHGYAHLPGPLGFLSGVTLHETWIES
jgi:glutathione transport system substrate-binding protein